MSYSVEYYERVEGSRPAEEFIISQDVKMRAKQGSDTTRVLYFFISGKKVILTNGFVKKTARTPSAEIDGAKRYRADYQSREKPNGKEFPRNAR